MQHIVVEKFTRLSVYAFTDPWDFLLNLGIILAPLFLVAAFCAYKLAKSSGKKSAKKPGPNRMNGKPERQMPPRAAKKSKKDN